MSSLNRIGSLMSLYANEITAQGHEYSQEQIDEAAAAIKAAGRNWNPVIVKEIGEDQYEVVGNELVFQAAICLGLERVWCVIADDSAETAASAEAGNVKPVKKATKKPQPTKKAAPKAAKSLTRKELQAFLKDARKAGRIAKKFNLNQSNAKLQEAYNQLTAA